MPPKIEAGEEYRGPCGILKDSNWLSAETLPTDKDTIAQIEKVIRRKTVEFKGGGRNETKHSYGSLKFVGMEKELGLNVTNLRVLSALFGSDTSAWFGKWIALYVDPSVSAFGQIVSAVRIRAKHIEAPSKSAATKPERVPASATQSTERSALITRVRNAATMLKRSVSIPADPIELARLCDELEDEAMRTGEATA